MDMEKFKEDLKDAIKVLEENTAPLTEYKLIIAPEVYESIKDDKEVAEILLEHGVNEIAVCRKRHERKWERLWKRLKKILKRK